MTNAERAIKHLARENFKSFESDWESLESGDLADDLHALADGYYDNRNTSEIERDKKEGATEEDYFNWVEEAFYNHFPEKS